MKMGWRRGASCEEMGKGLCMSDKTIIFVGQKTNTLYIMEDNNNKFISVVYDLSTVEPDGEQLVEQTTEELPFSFITGFGVALLPFEEAVKDLLQGGTFDFTLTPEQGYGEYEEQRVLDLAKEMFCDEGKFDDEHVKVGAVIPLQNQEGQVFPAEVLNVGDDTVRVDLNHPLAGKTLRFKGHVSESRPATAEEINHLVRHLAGEGCGCGCESCGTGCGDECNHEHHGDHCGCGHCM